MSNAIYISRSQVLLHTWERNAHLKLEWRQSLRYLSAVPKNVQQNHAPFQELSKDNIKLSHNAGKASAQRKSGKIALALDQWELTVGIEVHAQLNTDCKLFSNAATSISEQANTHVSIFDLALPGTQPVFQKAAILPALRAAVAFKCNIMSKSRFDRKHYFYPDQPAGYQITQFYEPFATGGIVTINDHEGIAPEDGKSVTVGIKQIQLEQDTAKTTHQASSTTLLDFNRVSHPLIEIITLPQIHHPQTAAACLKKIQSILQSVNAVTTGMEMGGIRADVNVSVRSIKPTTNVSNSHAYEGITGLGQRTEIKNLSSIKAVEDAIFAERDRQIRVLEAGGTVEGQTRSWTLASSETVMLRGKEGEIDYRYMPDPDLAPVIIDPILVKHISNTLPMLPDDSIDYLVNHLNLTLKDAKTLVTLDDGARLDYFDEILMKVNDRGRNSGYKLLDHRKYAKTLGNWVIHELGGLLSGHGKLFSENIVSATAMASIVDNLMKSRITGTTAKRLLHMAFKGESRDIDAIIEEERMGLETLPREDYLNLAQDLIKQNDKMVQQIKFKGQHGKLNWFVGQMMRKGGSKVEASKAEATLKEVLGLNTE